MMNEPNEERFGKEKYDPEEKVARMNSIFDKLVLPIVLFTLAVFLIFGIIPKLSCVTDSGEDTGKLDNYELYSDPYLLRTALLDDMEKNKPFFEKGGYAVVGMDDSTYVAYLKPDENTQYVENVKDSNNSVYSAIVHDKGEVKITVKIYNKNAFLVIVDAGERSCSAIFNDDSFKPGVSDTDADRQAVLEEVTSEELSGLVEQYKQKIRSLVG